jgi:predicted short-subunit dehydrogenase-like oxidoreductase (DUF2520 family)
MDFDKSTKIAFIGCGAVGKTLAVALFRAGYSVVAASSRTYSSAKALASLINGCVSYESISEAALQADLIFITTFDSAIEPVVNSIKWSSNQAVVHCSGVSSLDILKDAKRQGVFTGSFHPLQAFAGVDDALAALPGSTFGIEGEGRLKDYLTQLALDVGGRPIFLKSSDKPLYHASAVTLGGVLMGQIAVIAQIWQDRLGVERNEALKTLIPMIRGVADALEANGIPDGIAGPYVRGDVDTIKKHLEAMKSVGIQEMQMYATAALAGIKFAAERGVCKTEDVTVMKNLLNTYINKYPI